MQDENVSGRASAWFCTRRDFSPTVSVDALRPLGSLAEVFSLRAERPIGDTKNRNKYSVHERRWSGLYISLLSELCLFL
jgi:hypothetical protein